MRNINHFYTATFTLAFLSFAALTLTSQVNAAEGLNVAPPLITAGLQAGDERTWEILLTNPGLQPRSAVFVIKSLEIANGKFYPSLNTQEAMSWISVPTTEYEIPPQEKLVVPVTINVPTNAVAGAYQFALLFRDTEVSMGEQGANVAAIGEIGPAFLLNIGTGLTEELIPIAFYSEQQVTTSPTANLLAELRNQGEAHVLAQGVVNIQPKLFSANLVKRDFNQTHRSQPVGTASIYAVSAEINPLLPGPYTAELAVVYGSTNKVFTVTTEFWYIPTWLIIGGGVAIIFLILSILRARRRKLWQ
jgi:hypothetical protein